MSRSTLLQLGGGLLMRHSIRLLRDAGWNVHAVDRNPAAPAFALADASAAVDISDSDAVAEYAAAISADLIMAVSDAGVMAAAQASRRMGLPNLPVEVAARSLDKGLMRDAWAVHQLPQPAYRVVHSAEEIHRTAAQLGFPVMVKPALNGGSRGVSFVADEARLPAAIDFAQRNCPNGRFLVEEAVEGTEMTIEGLVQRGRPQVLAKSDKEPQPHPTYRVAMALNYPAAFPAPTLEHVDDVVGRAALALGIENGAFHCECMVNERGIQLIEMGARPGGGHIFSQLVEASSGIRMPVALASVYMGQDLDLRPRYQRGACYKFFTPPPGRLREVFHVERASQMPGILDFGFTLRPGALIGPVAADPDRPGYVASAGASREEAIANADRAIAQVTYRLDPLRADES